jgi:hypothetical protein
MSTAHLLYGEEDLCGANLQLVGGRIDKLVIIAPLISSVGNRFSPTGMGAACAT